eukprot:CAMPEP_0174760668 /NCGR_PEP_ID=MMETSP1094-20130205/108890_1 /TAXON_ID=156173 /ORGANISM="Chrysochromulina brevifilum, Strain UTEX LB 985" /LENGTH=113 /DNA_ID=CAMNT_0015966609 /DNA_START=182 /DNA_END=520 /DNA_ORIENTATION=-
MADTDVLWGVCTNAACGAGNHLVAECTDPACTLAGSHHLAVERGCSSCREYVGRKGAASWRPVNQAVADFCGIGIMSSLPFASALRVCGTCISFVNAQEVPNGKRGSQRASRW